MFKSMKGRAAASASVLAIAAVVASLGFAQPQEQQARADERTSARAEKIKVGTYEFDRVIQGYHETQKFVAYAQELEREFQDAQETGDQQRAFDIQMRAQTELHARQEQLMASFNQVIDEVVPRVARENDLKIVALELIYFGESVEPEDITEQVIAAINEGADLPDPQPMTDPEDDE